VGVLRDGFRDRIMPEIDHHPTCPLLRSVAIAAHLWKNHFSPMSLQRAKRSAESTEFDAQEKKVLDCEDSTVCGYASISNGFRRIERRSAVPMRHGIIMLQVVFF